MTSINGETVGKYKILSEIGKGGMGEVYLAQDIKLNRNVALKMLPADFANDSERMQRFIQEAQAASALNHPNIITIHEIGETNGTHFIATEFIDGKTLSDYAKTERIIISSALDIAVQVASALDEAHMAGIVHRDIKPDNIMVRSNGHVKILDFGIAKLTGKRNPEIDSEDKTAVQVNTMPGTIIGTANYMSPEQAKGKEVDARTDIFSFGVVLYEMVSGSRPFEGDSTNETIAAILNSEPLPLASYVANVPAELERIVSKTLRKDPEKRYQHFKDLLIDIQDLKQELEFEAKLERSTQPNLKKRENDESETTATLGRESVRQIATTAGQNISSAEYITNGLKQHKFISIAGLSTIIITLAAFSYFTYFAPSSPITSVAVLPLENGSGDPKLDYLSDGLSENLIDNLSKLRQLKVIARNSSFKFRGKNIDFQDVANKLGVQAIVTGKVMRLGDKPTVRVELIDARENKQLWGERYELEMKNIFKVQDEVTLAVVDALKLNLLGKEKSDVLKRYTPEVTAYEYFLKGNHNFGKVKLVNTPEIDVAIAMFKKAIEIDPNYPLAHARLILCYVWKAVHTDPENPRWIELAKKELEEAERLDAELPQIFEARSYIAWSKYGNFDITTAVHEVRRAMQFDKNSGHHQMGVYAFHTGMFDLAAREFRLAADVDPTSDMIKLAAGHNYALLGRYDQAIEIGKQYGGDSPGFTYALLWQNRIKEAEVALNAALAKDPNNPHRQGEQVLLLALQGKHDKAEALIPLIRSRINISQYYHHVTYNFASAYALNGKSVESVKWLQETVDHGMPIYPLFERDPHLNKIRQTPEFVSFMRNLKPRWEKIVSVFE